MYEYYRLARLNYRFFERMLALPKGFEVDAIFMAPETRSLDVRIRCPEDFQFKVTEFQIIPEIAGPTINFAADGTVTKVWWPELGQKEPPEALHPMARAARSSFGYDSKEEDMVHGRLDPWKRADEGATLGPEWTS